jgi:hypothetical protein
VGFKESERKIDRWREREEKTERKENNQNAIAGHKFFHQSISSLET